MAHSETAILDALRRHAPDAQPEKPGAWRVCLKNGRPIPMTARIDGPWLVFDGAFIDKPRAPWHLLRQGSQTEPPAKFILDNAGLVRLRAEIPIPDDEQGIAERVAQTMTSLIGAVSCISHGRPSGAERTTPKGDAVSPSVDVLRDLVGEAGWPVRDRNGLWVDLQVQDAIYQARIAAGPRGVTASVPLAWPVGAYSRASCEALAVLLLTAARLVRWARPFLRGKKDQVTAGWEIHLGTTPDATEIDDGLAALAAASALCGREARLLGQAETAREYLAVQNGWTRETRKENVHG